MKIALSFPGCYRRGGVERVALETANHLAGADHAVHLFAHDWDQAALDSRITAHPVPLPSRGPMARERRFPERCDTAIGRSGIRFDARAGFGVMAPPGALVWVQSVHAAWLAICQRQRRRSARWRQILNPYHRLILNRERRMFGDRRYRRLIALTEQVKQDLIDHYAVPEADVNVLSNGFSEAEFNMTRRDTERNACRAELGYGEYDKVIIFVANETERKGFGPLLRAAALQNDPRVHLLAVGRLNAHRYAGEIARLGMQQQVRFIGPAADVGRYYAAADVFALPTQYEAWGLVIIEAMAAGLPALTSRLAGAAVAVQPGQNGELLDDPRDEEELTGKLASLLARHHQPHEAISQSVRPYAWPNVLQRYESILADVVAGDLARSRA